MPVPVEVRELLLGVWILPGWVGSGVLAVPVLVVLELEDDPVVEVEC